jgi:CRISPR-associated protein Csd1
MTWMQRLYETYERCVGREPDGSEKLMPILHMKQRAQIEVILNGKGEFRRALIVPPNDAATLIPVTEESAGRTSKATPHPLCDRLQYVAGDYTAYERPATARAANKAAATPYQEFVSGLQEWSDSAFTHPKAEAILAYVQRGRLVRDLVNERMLHVDGEGYLLSRWEGNKATAPPIFTAIRPRSQNEALVRWRVEAEIGDPLTATWEDEGLIEAWIRYYQSRARKLGFCMVTGSHDILAAQHPKGILRGRAAQAKLISSNDVEGYTFRGRFLDADEAVSVGLEVTQKAHHALRWLIARQAYRADDDSQAFVAWSPGGANVPPPDATTLELFDDENGEPADTAEAFARRLNRKIAGYRSELGARDDVVVMGIESATPGRLSVTYYRTLMGSEFLDRVERWHSQFAWYQKLGDRNRSFVGAPSPKLIAEAAFGRRGREDDKLRRATVERLIPCIVDAVPVPRDLVQLAVRRACNPFAMRDVEREKARAEWEKTLSVACGLVRGYHVERNYQMALETDRKTRDYLYGRLLAVADNIERLALWIADENRSTTAERLMQRFADRPSSTWRTIELALSPYKARLRSSRPRFLVARESLIQ